MDLSQLKKESKGYLKEESPERKKGRPILNEQPMDKKITINLTENEYNKIFEHCRSTGVNATFYIRKALKDKKVI